MAKRLEINPDRFYDPMPQEEWDYFKTKLEERGSKLIIIDTEWNNKLTRCKGHVNHIPILATKDNSDRPMAITSITKYTAGKEDNYTLHQVARYTYNNYYAHTNIHGSMNHITITAESVIDWAYYPSYGDEDAIIPGTADLTRKECGEKNDSYLSKIPYQAVAYKICYQSICSPITQHHFYTQDLNNLAIIFKSQLTGQNSGSPFQTVSSVANTYTDHVIKDSYRGNAILRTAPIIQLITRRHLDYLHDVGNLNDLLESVTLPHDETECMVKEIDRASYIVAKTEELDTLQLSEYYPIITYEEIKNIIQTLPKIELDFVCCGLGSAGTMILDQVSRSNYFKNYLLCDFDTVEDKNLRNQWYINNHVGNKKVRASAGQLRYFNPGRDVTLNITEKECRFQDINWSKYTCKYIVSGFDSIAARLDLLNYIKEGIITAKYLIDTRYDELTSSIFVIDTSNEEEMTYYERGLLSDYEAFKEIEEKEHAEKYVTTEEDFLTYFAQKELFRRGCVDFRINMFGDGISCGGQAPGGGGCNSDNCKKYLLSLWREHKPLLLKSNEQLPESSCVRQNFIDIYKFSSSFVFAAIREIESEDGSKPFTHVEAQTEKIPTAMVLRK